MGGAIKSSLTRRILNACGATGGRNRRRVSAPALVESLEDRQLLAAAVSAPVSKYATSPVAKPSSMTTSTAVKSTVAMAPLSETFNLSSRPSASKTIYLDFNGHTTSGTIWNTTFNFGQSIVSPAFSLDGNTGAFSNAELTQIQRMWQRVVEDFAPFDVNVTTKDPGIADLVNSGGSDTRWGIRVVIGGAYQDWLGAGAGGIAYINSFGSPTDIPCFVFSETQLLNEQYIADTISHEAGHTLGLSHDGTPTLEYYSGHGNGAMSWGPIMGSTFDRNISQWSKGEYTSANNQEDDLTIITTQNGFGYRADDYGNSRFTASQLPTKKVGSTRTVNTSGVIEQNTDTDWFSFTTTGGQVNLLFSGDSISSNLDISVSLYNAAGTLVMPPVNPANSLSANLVANLPAGTYTVMVDGVGFGSLASGYSDYGSLGQYYITGTIPDTSSGTSSGGTSVISGRVVSDANNDGILNGTDAGIAGVMVFIDKDGNGVFNAAVDQSARTDSTGAFQFTGLLGGTYNIYQIPPSGWQQANPAGGPLNVFVAVASTESNRFFRNVRPPVVSGLGASVTYKRGTTPMLLSPSGVVKDADTATFTGARLTVGISENAGAGDVIAVRNQGNGAGQVGAFAGFVRFGGVTVGTMSGGAAGSSLVITFNSNATLAIVQAILRNLTFATTSAVGARSVAFSMTDGSAGSSSTLTKQVKVM